MEIVLIRHGQTAGNLAGQYIGKTDEPLCPQGIAAVRLAGIFPEVADVYVSSKRRTHETADILFPSAKQIICHDLREMDFGDFEGRSAIEMETDHEYRDWVDGGCQGVCPNGESTAEFKVRVRKAFDEIVKEKICLNNSCRRSDFVDGSADQRNEDRMIILAHGGTIMAVMAAFARPARDYFDWHTGNVKGWRTYLDKKTWDNHAVLTPYVQMEVIDL